MYWFPYRPSHLVDSASSRYFSSTLLTLLCELLLIDIVLKVTFDEIPRTYTCNVTFWKWRHWSCSDHITHHHTPHVVVYCTCQVPVVGSNSFKVWWPHLCVVLFTDDAVPTNHVSRRRASPPGVVWSSAGLGSRDKGTRLITTPRSGFPMGLTARWRCAKIK